MKYNSNFCEPLQFQKSQSLGRTLPLEQVQKPLGPSPWIFNPSASIGLPKSKYESQKYECQKIEENNVKWLGYWE